MRLTLMIPALLGTVFCYGQESILRGRISSNLESLKGATIVLTDRGKTTVSDNKGNYRVTQLDTGKAQVQITMVGYEARTIEVYVNQGENILDFELQPASSELEEVVVSGTLRPVRKELSPILVEVYSPQFLRKNPTPSVFEALQNINGVRPQLNCNVCNTGDIHINGLEGPYTMVTIDGMPIVSSLASVYGLFGIPTQLIERMEIVKGPASGLFGSEAVGGLINIITRSPEKAPVFTTTLMSTSWQEHSVDVGMKFRLHPKISTLLGINYFNYQHPFDKNHDQFTDITLQHRVSFFQKTNFTRKNSRAMSIAGRYFYEDRWGGDLRWNSKFRGTDSIYGESIYTSRWELIGNYQLPVNERLFFNFSATGHDQNSYYGAMPYHAQQKILFGQLTWEKDFGANHSALLGLAGRHNHYDDNSTATLDTTTGRSSPEKFLLPGIFLQDEWKINSNHTVLLGLRYDHHPVHKTILTPRIAYKWSPSAHSSLRLNAGTGFRVVSIFTEEHAALTGARTVEIAEQLKPEKSYNLNLTYSTKFTLGQMRFNSDVSGWYTYFHNQIIPDYLTDPNKIIYRNLNGFAQSRGITVNIDADLGKKEKLLFGVTLQDVARFDKVDDKYVKAPLLLTERWSGNWAFTRSFPSARLTLDYTGNIYGPMELPLISALDPRKPRSPIWSIQNIQLTRKFSAGWELFGGLKNILNWTPARNNPFIIARSHDPFDRNVQYDADGNVIASPENPYALTFDPSYVYAPNQGRRVFLGLRISVN